MTGASIRTSIIIPTYNGYAKVERLLPFIVSQLNETRELIVVEDGSTDGSTERIVDLIRNVPNASVIVQENGGRSVARNSGAKAARGEFLTFIDDDILVPPSFLDRIEDVQTRSPNAWITGSVVQDIVEIEHSDFLRYRSRLDYTPKFFVENAGGVLDKTSFTTQQLSVNSKLFKESGGFDEGLTDSEDFELSTRVKALEGIILHDYKNIVRHADYANFNKFISRQIEYRKSKAGLAKIRPNLAAAFPNFFQMQSNNSQFKLWIRKVFVYNCLWKSLFESKLRKVVPQALRFKLYDLVISSTVILYDEEGV